MKTRLSAEYGSSQNEAEEPKADELARPQGAPSLLSCSKTRSRPRLLLGLMVPMVFTQPLQWCPGNDTDSTDGDSSSSGQGNQDTDGNHDEEGPTDPPAEVFCSDIETGTYMLPGAEYAFYGVPYLPDVDIDELVPDDVRTVVYGPGSIEPASARDSFVVLKGFIRITQPGSYTFSPGYSASTANVMRVAGQQVHRRETRSSEREFTEVYLSQGFHPFEVVFFETINPFAIWVNGSRMNPTHLWHEAALTDSVEASVVGAYTALQKYIWQSGVSSGEDLEAQLDVVCDDYAQNLIETSSDDLVAFLELACAERLAQSVEPGSDDSKSRLGTVCDAHATQDGEWGDEDLAAYLDGVCLEVYRDIAYEALPALGSSTALLDAAFELVKAYEEVRGPLWIGMETRFGFNRRRLPIDIHTTVYGVMQGIVDYVYTADVVGACSARLSGEKFGSADYFPGKVDTAASPVGVHQVQINASHPVSPGRPVMYSDWPGRRPTGTYLPPGAIATVVVPEALVGIGYSIRVGAHSWDLSHRPHIQRLDRVSSVYDIRTKTTQIASPLGGGIYIEVPVGANAGTATVRVQGAVRSPYFSAKSFHQTSLSEWRETERNFAAPWADFQTEKFMMNVPTSWVSELSDPITLMSKWDAAMDVLNDLMGYPRLGGKETMYPQVDVIMRSSVHAPGYPSVNARYNPNQNYGGLSNSHLIRGPEFSPSYEFHEKGHGYLFVKYGGEQESTVNLLHVAVLNRAFGYSLDEAFRRSRGGGNAYHTLENTAKVWMTSFNFSPHNAPMGAGEKAYQLKGHAKFVDIARLFGWDVLDDFWKSINDDHDQGVVWSKHGSPIDDITLRLSEKAGVDLRPLLHFWGTPPANPEQLATRIAERGLPKSLEIYDAIMRYLQVVPENNAEFREFARSWWGRQPRVTGYWTEREHARQWDTNTYPDRWPEPVRPNGEMYTEESAAEIRSRILEILSLYY